MDLYAANSVSIEEMHQATNIISETIHGEWIRTRDQCRSCEVIHRQVLYLIYIGSYVYTHAVSMSRYWEYERMQARAVFELSSTSNIRRAGGDMRQRHVHCGGSPWRQTHAAGSPFCVFINLSEFMVSRIFCMMLFL